MTVFLTTHYMEEAAGADFVIVIDDGEIGAKGTPAELKEKYTTDRLSLVSRDAEALRAALDAERVEYRSAADQVVISVASTLDALPIIERFKDKITGFEVTKGTMDDAFIAVTGRRSGNERFYGTQSEGFLQGQILRLLSLLSLLSLSAFTCCFWGDVWTAASGHGRRSVFDGQLDHGGHAGRDIRHDDDGRVRHNGRRPVSERSPRTSTPPPSAAEPDGRLYRRLVYIIGVIMTLVTLVLCRKSILLQAADRCSAPRRFLKIVGSYFCRP
jgi:hypothetical protein